MPFAICRNVLTARVARSVTCEHTVLVCRSLERRNDTVSREDDRTIERRKLFTLLPPSITIVTNEVLILLKEWIVVGRKHLGVGVDIDAFAPVDKSKLRQQKPTNSPPPAYKKPNEDQLKKLRLQKPEQAKPVATGDIPKVAVGNIIDHERFGKGTVIEVEGSGADRKAKVRFENGGEKTLILRFAKFKVL